MGGDDGYGGVIGAFPYAWRQSTSWLFRGYVLVAALITIVVTLVVAFGVVQLLASEGRTEGTVAFVRAFYIVVGATVVVPIVTPVLVIARRYRRDAGVSPHDERVLAGAGYLFVGLVYLGLIASTPPANQTSVTGPVAPLVEILYGLPRSSGLVFPVVGFIGVYVAYKMTGKP